MYVGIAMLPPRVLRPRSVILTIDYVYTALFQCFRTGGKYQSWIRNTVVCLFDLANSTNHIYVYIPALFIERPVPPSVCCIN